MFMKKKALLLYPPQHCTKGYFENWLNGYSGNFPMGLLKISTFLKSQDYEIDFIDAFNVFDYENKEYQRFFVEQNIVRHARYGNFEQEKRTRPIYHVGLDYQEIKDRLQDLNASPDEVYISSLFTWSWQTTHECVRLIKIVFPNAKVILGGIYPSLCPEHAKLSGADKIVRGTFKEAQNCWLDKDILLKQGKFQVGMFKTSLGCPNNCSYCAVNVLEGKKMRFRDPLDVADEIISVTTQRNFD